MGRNLKMVSVRYLAEYSKKADKMLDWPSLGRSLRDRAARGTPEDFGYYMVASSLYSSKIEGNTLDADSYFLNKGKRSSPKRREVTEVDDLIKAYHYAASNKLDRANFLKAHALASRSLLPPKERGTVRDIQVAIRDAGTLRPVYIAVEPEYVHEEYGKLFDDVDTLLGRRLTYKQKFYHASMLHIWLAKVHPFTDGNGRSARLLEKWFLASKIGEAAWTIPSEKYYWDNRQEYYGNISLGYNYYALKWERCIPFLLMLPKALKQCP